MASGKGSQQLIGLLQLIFQATIAGSGNWLTLALNATSSPATNLYISLHNGNLTAASTQATNETAYTNYARIAVPRTTSGWGPNPPVTLVENLAAITFPACGVTGDTLTYVGIGLNANATQAGELLYFGALTSSLIVNNGITPQFAINALTIAET